MTRFKRDHFVSLIALLCLCGALLSSCKKDPGEIGLDLMNNDNMSVSYIDTLKVYAHAAYSDSLRSDETSVTVLGSYYDPIFGATNTDLVTEMWMTENNPNFGDNPVADSMVVYLHYTGDYYGELTTPLQVSIYELDEDIEYDSVYYSNRQCTYKPEPLSVFTFTPAPADSVVDPDLEKGAPRVVIPLNVDFANSILQADTINFVDNAAFSDLMRGFYYHFDPITTPGMGAAFDVDLLNTRSRVVLYYHNDTDTSEFVLRTSTYTPRYAQYEHDYSLADPELLQQLEGDTLLGNQKLYVQAMGGIKTVINIPEITSIGAVSNTAINEAKLIMEVYSHDTTWAPPANLEMIMIDEDGTRALIPDYDEGATYYDGSYNTTAYTYTFRITRYIQHVINGDITNKGLELIVSGGSINPNRAMFYGTAPQGHPDTLNPRFRTQIIYTNIEY